MSKVPGWLVTFTVLNLLLWIVAGSLAGVWVVILAWLWTGFLIGFVVPLGLGVDFSERLWIMMAWLPILWYESLRD